MQHSCIYSTIAFMEKLVEETVISGNTLDTIAAIREASAAVCKRKIAPALQAEAEALLMDADFQQLKHTGTFDELSGFIQQSLKDSYPTISKDVTTLLGLFFELVPTESVRLSFAAVRNGMCKKFHTDITDYRLLCTYKGVGTEFVRSEALAENAKTINKSDIESLNAGEVILFRGALSATEECPPLLHKSPAVETEEEHRLLLRLDTNTTVWE